MNRRSRMTGALMAMFTLFALASAASASATTFEVEGAGPKSGAGWGGTSNSTYHKLSLPEGVSPVTCSGSTLGGTLSAENPTELTVSPTLSSCVFNGQSGGEWQINGCQYRLHNTGTFDIVNCKSPMSYHVLNCTMTIGNQSGLGTVTYSSPAEAEGLRSVVASAAVQNLTYTTSEGCGHVGTYSNGSYTGSWMMKQQSGTGQGSAIVSTGSGTSGKKVLAFPSVNSSLNCTTWRASGPVAGTPAEAVTLTVTSMSNCTSFGVQPSVSMGGCKFLYTASGGFQIVGSTCATNPIVISGTDVITGKSCTVKVGPSSPLAGLILVPQGLNNERVLAFGESEAAGFTYTASGALCTEIGGHEGTFSDGVKNGNSSRNSPISAESFGGKVGIWLR